MTRDALPWAAFAATAFIWGSTFLAIRVSNEEGFDPMSAVVLRLAAASLVFVGAARALRIRFPRGRDLGVTALAGLLIFAVNFGLLYWGETMVDSGTAAVLWGVFPTLTALGAAFMLGGKEPLTARALAGGALAAAGLVVVFWSELSTDAPLPGLLAILGGITAAATAGLLTKRFAHDVHPVAFNAVGQATGAAALLPVALVGGLELPATTAAWGSLAYLTLAGSVVAFTLWAWLLKRWPATRVSYQTVMSPLIAVALGALVLDEEIGSTFLAGTALVLAGTVLATRAAR